MCIDFGGKEEEEEKKIKLMAINWVNLLGAMARAVSLLRSSSRQAGVKPANRRLHQDWRGKKKIERIIIPYVVDFLQFLFPSPNAAVIADCSQPFFGSSIWKTVSFVPIPPEDKKQN